MNQDLLRLIDSIHREKSIDKETLFIDLETAIASAAKRQFGGTDDVTVHVDRSTGDIFASRGGVPVDVRTLGRIAAQTAKQVVIQRFREGERKSIFDEYKGKEGDIITGTVARVDGGILVVNLGRSEGFLPRSEQIPGETHHPGERIRCLILEVREAGHQVKIVLSRTHPDFIKRLFELEVPEVAERIIEIKTLAREAGYRTKIAVASIDSKVDAVGACVGVRGSRIKNIVDELGGEKIDIVRWNESSQILIANALRPAEISEIRLCFEFQRATVVVNDDQLSLAIGRRGQNVRLAARLTGWDIDIVTPAEFNDGVQRMISFLRAVEGVDDEMTAKIHALGMLSVHDLTAIDPEAFIDELQMDPALAAKIQDLAKEEAKKIDIEKAAAAAAAAAERRNQTQEVDPLAAVAAALGATPEERAAELARGESEEERIRALLRGERDAELAKAQGPGPAALLSSSGPLGSPAVPVAPSVPADAGAGSAS
jgi:N utilization substance protein A